MIYDYKINKWINDSSVKTIAEQGMMTSSRIV